MQETWGEFLDDEWYATWPEPTFEPPRPEPWRERWSGKAVMVPRDLLERMAQPRRMVEIQRCYMDRVYQVASELYERGLEEPLQLIVDQQGRIVLYNGHHRLTGTSQEEWPAFPCTITQSEKITTDCQPLDEVLLFELVTRCEPT